VFFATEESIFFTPPFLGLAPFVVENLMTVYLRFADLKALGIVRNHTTLKRWIEKRGFPVGIWNRRKYASLA